MSVADLRAIQQKRTDWGRRSRRYAVAFTGALESSGHFPEDRLFGHAYETDVKCLSVR